MRNIRIALVIAAAAVAVPASAIVIRPDRDDAEYLEMASRYTSSVAIPGAGEGVLIAPRWVLTSAQVGSALRAMKAMPALAFDARSYDIEEVLVYPTWRAGTVSSDIALVYLGKAVRGVKPTPLYTADDEGGQAVVIAGHGSADGKARAAINTIDRVSPRVLTLLLKKPEEASDLQGALSPGDRGGPAFIQQKDDLFVAGIAIGPDESDGNAQLYTRVSAFVPWIRKAFEKAAKEELREQLETPGN